MLGDMGFDDLRAQCIELGERSGLVVTNEL
jgi:hypothetical protein